MLPAGGASAHALVCGAMAESVRVMDSGMDGNISWTIAWHGDNCILDMEGSGAMPDHSWDCGDANYVHSEYAYLPDTIRVGEGITRIGNNAFIGYYTRLNVTYLDLADSVLEIGESAFANHISLGRANNVVVLPANLRLIQRHAFMGCTGLWSVYIPASVQVIEEGAFLNCSYLREIRYGGTEAQWNAIAKDGNEQLMAAHVVYGASPEPEPTPEPTPVPTPEPTPTPAPTPAPYESQVLPFTDVPHGIWYEDAVRWAVYSKVVAGTSENTFSPTTDCSHEQIITMLWNATGQYPSWLPIPNFYGAAGYAEDAVSWAISAGILAFSPGDEPYFSPKKTCTRGDIVYFLWKFSGEEQVPEANFRDLPADPAYRAAISWASQYHVTAGTADGLFEPDKPCDRSQAVTFLFNMYNNVPAFRE